MARLIFIYNYISMKDYKNPRELVEYVLKAAELNPDYTTQEILEAALERGDTLWWVKVTDIIEKDNDFGISLVEAINKPAKEIDLSGLDLSFEEPEEVTDLNSAMKSEWKTPIEAKEVWSDNNFEVFKNFWERYKQVHWEKKDLIDKYNWWKGYPDGSEAKKEYEQKLKIYNDTLNEMEDWEEFYNIVKSIKDYWIWWKNVIPEKVAMAIQTIADKEYSNDNDTKSITRSIFWNDYVDSWNATHTFDLSRSDIDKVIDNYLSSHKTKSSWWENADIKWETKSDTKSDTKSNNKNNISVNWPFKPMNPTNEKVADEMSFGSWVKWAGWNQYLEERNKSLALHLKMKWIETPEEIDAYLSKYPSWKNAKQERKDNTLGILTDKISNMQNTFNVSKKDDLNKDEAKKVNWGKWEKRDVDENKGRLNKRLEDAKWMKDKASTRDVKDKKRLWDDWQPDNDSSINWTEELKTENDWNDFWNEDQKNETKKQIVKRPEKLNVKSAKKETKNNDKKPEKKVSMKDIVKVVKSSPTIKNLLKNSKK